MDVSHVQLASQATSSNEVVLGAEGGDLRSAIGPHWGSLPRQAAAVQHLHSSRASWDMSLKAPASTEAMPGGCHVLLRMDIELHGRRLPLQTAAGQHLSSSAASETCVPAPLPACSTQHRW